MAAKFDVIDYLSGLTGFIFDKAVLKRIALDRGVSDVTEYSQLDAMTKDLLLADLLYVAYYSPSIWASVSNANGSYSQSIGSQTIKTEDKERVYNRFVSIYKKYDDEKLEQLEDNGYLQWL